MNRLDYSVALLPNIRTGEKKAYAYLQSRGTYTIDELADMLVERGSNYDRGDAYAIIVKLTKYVKDILLDGYTVDLGDLGRMRLTCSSEGAASLKEFTRDKIKHINVKFKPSEKFDNLLNEVTLHKVPSRRVVAAALEAQLNGDTTADWSELDGELPRS